MATKTAKARSPLARALKAAEVIANLTAPDKPVTLRLVRQIARDASTAAAPVPWPVVWPIFTSLIQALFPCLANPTPASVQERLSNPNRLQQRRMDNALFREWDRGGRPGRYLAFSHAVFGQCRQADVSTVTALMRENRPQRTPMRAAFRKAVRIAKKGKRK